MSPRHEPSEDDEPTEEEVLLLLLLAVWSGLVPNPLDVAFGANDAQPPEDAGTVGGDG